MIATIAATPIATTAGRAAREAVALGRAAAAVALVAGGLVLSPGLWLGLALWMWAAGWRVLAVPAGLLAVLALLVVGLLTLRAAARTGG
jgi:hypothetical protein